MGLRGDWLLVSMSRERGKGVKECMGIFRSFDVSTTVYDHVLCQEC
jgi:hypothetical protein